jgi:hypothetical protein
MDFETCDRHRPIGPDLRKLSVTELSAEWHRLMNNLNNRASEASG